jgi:hypothetical protein
MSGDHHFDRRSSDGNVASLAIRVDALERRMETVEIEVRNNNRELAANTALTEEIHGNTADMAEMFKATRNGFRMLAGAGNLGLKALETGGKIARPMFWIVAVGIATVAYVKTGTWTMPTWWK